VPDESHMAGISSRMEAVRQDLTLQEGTLTDLEQNVLLLLQLVADHEN